MRERTRAAASRKGQGCLLALNQWVGGEKQKHMTPWKKTDHSFFSLSLSLSPHNLSTEAGGFAVSQPLFNTFTLLWLCSDWGHSEWRYSGKCRGMWSHGFWQTVFTVHVAHCISRGTKQRPMRQPDESVLFICASARVHCAVCHVTIAKTLGNPTDHFGVWQKAAQDFERQILNLAWVWKNWISLYLNGSHVFVPQWTVYACPIFNLPDKANKHNRHSMHTAATSQSRRCRQMRCQCLAGGFCQPRMPSPSESGHPLWISLTGQQVAPCFFLVRLGLTVYFHDVFAYLSSIHT